MTTSTLFLNFDTLYFDLKKIDVFKKLSMIEEIRDQFISEDSIGEIIRLLFLPLFCNSNALEFVGIIGDTPVLLCS